MCISPKRMFVNGNWVDVPCMRCYECIRKRKKDWTIRLTQHLFSSDCAFFSLLSYDDEHYPDPPVADKVGLQNFIRRLRRVLSNNSDLLHVLDDAIYEHNIRVRQISHEKYMKLPVSLRYVVKPDDFVCSKIKLDYFIVSEYGEERNRLHYHAIFFLKGISSRVMTYPLWKCLVEYVWKQGFCSAFVLDNHWITYACKYIQKSYNFMLHSRIGKDAFLKEYRYHWKPRFEYDLPFFPIKGKPLLPPKTWLKDLLGDQYYNIAIKKFINEHPNTADFKTRYMLNTKHVHDNPDLWLNKSQFDYYRPVDHMPENYAFDDINVSPTQLTLDGF